MMKAKLAFVAAVCLLAAWLIAARGGMAVAQTYPTPMPTSMTVATPMATAATSGQTGVSTGVGTGVSAGVSSSTGASAGVSGSAGASTSASTGFFSPTNRPAVVPAGATEVGRVTSGTTTTVTYLSGNLYYHVSYSPNGAFTYSITSSPSSTGAVSAAGGTTTLPRTGGGTPASPLVPALLGLLLAASGLTVRRLTR